MTVAQLAAWTGFWERTNTPITWLVAPNPDAGDSHDEREEEEEAGRLNAIVMSGDRDWLLEWATLSGDDALQDDWWVEHADAIRDLIGQPCQTYLTSPDASASGDCYWRLQGDNASCSYLACDVAAAIPDMETYARDDLPINIKDWRDVSIGYQSYLDPILRAAWTVLMDNIDLVRWTLCLVKGADVSECVPKAILGDRLTRTAIRITDADGWVAGAYPGVDIFIGSQHSYWLSAVTNWGCGDNATRAVIAVDVAVTLFHELTHVCANALWDYGEAGCAYSYVAESSFRWAIFRRYDALRGATCWDSALSLSTMFAADHETVAQLDLQRRCDPTSCGGTYSAPVKELAEVPLTSM